MYSLYYLYVILTGLQRSVVTGTEPWGLGLNETTLPQLLKSLGYRSHIIGKVNMGSAQWLHSLLVCVRSCNNGGIQSLIVAPHSAKNTPHSCSQCTLYGSIYLWLHSFIYLWLYGSIPLQPVFVFS